MKKNCLATILLALILSVNSVAFATGKSTPSPSPEVTSTQSSENKEEKKSEFPIPNADSAIVIDTKSGDVIYALDADKKVYPAGLTNIMTAILVLENKGLADNVKITKDMLAGITYDQPTTMLQMHLPLQFREASLSS